TEIPRSRSIAIQSERVRRRSPRALTSPASWIAPPNSKSFSVKVVLPASGCEMIAKVRRRKISSVSVLIDGMVCCLLWTVGRAVRCFATCVTYEEGPLLCQTPYLRVLQPEREPIITFCYMYSDSAASLPFRLKSHTAVHHILGPFKERHRVRGYSIRK